MEWIMWTMKNSIWNWGTDSTVHRKSWKKPNYIHNHAYFTKTEQQVTLDSAKKYNIPTTLELGQEIESIPMDWYGYGSPND